MITCAIAVTIRVAPGGWRPRVLPAAPVAPGTAAVVAGGMKVLFEREPVRTEAVFELFLGLVQRVRAVHVAQEEVLLLLEAVVAQADRVLDDVVGAPFIALLADGEVAPPQQAHLFASFGFVGWSVGFHRSAPLSPLGRGLG